MKFEYYKKENKNQILGVAMGWDNDICYAIDFKNEYSPYKQISLSEFRDICCKFNCLTIEYHSYIMRNNIPICISY